MKSIKISLVVMLVFFSFVFGSDVSAVFLGGIEPGDSCSEGDDAFCSGDQRFYCSSVGEIAGVYTWRSITCSLGCSDGYCIDGTCGAANNTAVDSAPTSGLCNTGSVSWTDQTGDDGIFNWRCTGTDCKAYKNCTCGLANGQTYTGDLPTGSEALCKLGNASTPSFSSSTGAWSWTCDTNSTCTIKNYCTAYRKPTGGCGTADGQTFSSTSSLQAANLCSLDSEYWIDYVVAYYEEGEFLGYGYNDYTIGDDINDGVSVVGWSWGCPLYFGTEPLDGEAQCEARLSCSGMCVSMDYCITNMGGVVNGYCSYGVCCDEGMPDITCYNDAKCGDCHKCIYPGTVNSYCGPKTINKGENGVIGAAKNSSMCNITVSTPDLCTTKYGVTINDSNGTDKTFNWTCNGQPEGTCNTAGIGDTSGSATKLDKLDGECSTTTDKCNPGTPINTGITQVVTTGIDNIWDCEGTCSGATDNCRSPYCTKQKGKCNNDDTGKCLGDGDTASNVGTTIVSTGINNIWTCKGPCNGEYDYCSNINCTNKLPVNGQCINVATLEDVDNHTLCIDPKQESNVTVTEDMITWICLGSTNTCAEGDGDDKPCSSEIDQKNWYQVNNGNILAKGQVTNSVPITCDNSGNNCVSSAVVNGFIYSPVNSSLSSHDGMRDTTNAINGLHVNTFPYSELKNSYFKNKGVGTNFEEGTDWSTIKNTPGVLFVEGDLEINDALVTPNFVMIVAEGTITINPNVNQIDAILVANKVVAAAADESSTGTVSQLVINGMVHGVSGVEFSRSLYEKKGNNTKPSVVVNYSPELLFMIPPEISKEFVRWKVN